MSINSRSKGKRGELEAAALLREHGFEAHRGQQFSGGADSQDLVHNVPATHFEIKRTESLNVYKALDQAQADAGDNTPIVLHRRSQREWVAILPAADLLTLLANR